MMMATCPECDADMVFDTMPGLDQRFVCSRCRAALVIIGLSPIALDWAYVEPLRDLYHDGASTRPDLELRRDA